MVQAAQISVAFRSMVTLGISGNWGTKQFARLTPFERHPMRRLAWMAEGEDQGRSPSATGAWRSLRLTADGLAVPLG